jgi:hypothetical protein
VTDFLSSRNKAAMYDPTSSQPLTCLIIQKARVRLQIENSCGTEIFKNSGILENSEIVNSRIRNSENCEIEH